jgi:hypothetical protein
MLRIALLAALALPARASDHARWHAADTDVMVEVPSVQPVLRAYESAPFVRTLRDESIASIAEIAKGLGWDVAAMVSGFLPKPDPSRPDDPAWPWSKLESASFSVDGIDPTTTGFELRGSRRHVRRARVLGSPTPARKRSSRSSRRSR